MAHAAKAFLFRPYRMVPDRRALFADSQEIPIRSRAFDLLLALVERRERIVSKDELMELVWPGRVVEKGNLTVGGGLSPPRIAWWRRYHWRAVSEADVTLR